MLFKRKKSYEVSSIRFHSFLYFTLKTRHAFFHLFSMHILHPIILHMMMVITLLHAMMSFHHPFHLPHLSWHMHHLTVHHRYIFFIKLLIIHHMRTMSHHPVLSMTVMKSHHTIGASATPG